MVKVGIIGAGMVSGGHLTAMLRDSRVDFMGVADPSQAARDHVASQYGVATFDDHRPLVDKSDLIIICTPHHLHKPLALEAIGAGKHVICEKPLAMNASEAEEMLSAAQRAGVRLFVAENFRYIPEIARIRDLLNSRAIGDPFLCLSCVIGDEYDRMSDPKSWKGTKDKSGGGSIVDQGPHALDSLYWFFGEVEKISAMAGRLVVPTENKEEDTAQIIITFKSGVLANCALTFGARYNGFPEGYIGFGSRFDIDGTAGAAHTLIGRGVTVVTGGKSAHMPQEELPQPSMAQDFISAVLGEKDPLVSGRDGLYVMRMVDACYESIRTGKAVAL